MVSLRQAGLRRKYCNPTQGSCIDPIHEAHSDGHKMEVHLAKAHGDKIECGLCEYEAKDLEALESIC